MPHPYRSANSLAQARATLADRLRARRPEIERAILTRVHAIADPSEVPDPEYLPGLRRAVSAAIDYSILSVEVGEKQLTPIPVPLLGQARVAARNEVSLNTVLQRCAAGYTILVHFMEEEAAQDDRLQRGVLMELRSSQVALLDRLLSALSDEHGRGDRDCPGSSQAVLTQRVVRLLAGELVDTSEIAYDFEAYHVGVVAKGPGAGDAVRDLAKAFDSRFLYINIDDDGVWAWLGIRDEIDRQQLGRFVTSAWPSTMPLALGEAGRGRSGWRLTHRQARVAFLVSLERSGDVTQYADVALLASMKQDDLLSTSLRELYINPLAQGREDGGAGLRDTLRAYFTAGRNAASAASALRVSRQTVANHIKTVEQCLGQPLTTCALEMEVALRTLDID
jgi:hypothetical protein